MQEGGEHKERAAEGSDLRTGTAGTPVLGLQGVDMSTPVVDPPPVGSDTADEGVEKPQDQSADEALPATSPDATEPEQVAKDTALLESTEEQPAPPILDVAQVAALATLELQGKDDGAKHGDADISTELEHRLLGSPDNVTAQAQELEEEQGEHTKPLIPATGFATNSPVARQKLLQNHPSVAKPL